MVELHFSLIFLLEKLHFSLFWLLEKLHFSLFLSFEVCCRHITESGGMAKLKTRGRRVEVSRGGTSERFAPKTFTVPVRPQVKAFFAIPRLQGGAKEAKFVPLCTKKGRRRKNVKRNRARGARFHLSHLYVFQGYMHFLQTLHSSGLKLDNHRGKCVGFGLKILHKTLHRVGFRGGVCRVVVKQKI